MTKGTYLERISLLIKETYDMTKQIIVAAIRPVTCGQTNKRLCPSGKGPGMPLLLWDQFETGSISQTLTDPEVG